MRAQDDLLSHFDHAINAMLLMSYVALRQGDAVGLLSFGNGKRWVPACKGAGSVNTLLNAVYDLHTASVASDYTAAIKELLTRQRKRSLVVLITNTRDENNEDLIPAIKLLKKYHLVLVANLRENVLDEAQEQPVDNFQEALRYAGTVEYLDHRKTAQNELLSKGVFSIDCLPRQLASDLVNRYLDIKRSGSL